MDALAAGPRDPDVAERLGRLRGILVQMESVLVAFSGGVDSTLLLAVAHETLGDRAAALTAASASLIDEEQRAAAAIATALGARHIVVPSGEIEQEAYAANTGDRCYHCKAELFDLGGVQARRLGFRWIADGSIVDDLSDHRPGLRAAAERGIRHPLIEAGLTKVHVRAAARARGLSVWDKPATPCLSSRFAVGTRVSLDRLARVARAERTIRDAGFEVVRVRIRDEAGREGVTVQVGPDALPRLADPGVREVLVAACRQEGFSWVTLDPLGYRRGSAATAPPCASPESATGPSTSPRDSASGCSSS